MKIRTALISVYDKTGVVDFARGLAGLGIRILSTGGTAALLLENGVSVTKLEEYTGLPEILDGRVKTLCYKVFSGLLYKRDNPDHQKQLADQGIDSIDMVVVNLYPFEKMMKKKLLPEELIEYIDIGGVSLLRAAAKNHKFVLPVLSIADYRTVIDFLKKDGDVPFPFRQVLAGKTFLHTSRYDALIAGSMATETGSPDYPVSETLFLEKIQDLRYGENPHQSACLYRRTDRPRLDFRQLGGKELSFNNIADFYSAAGLAAELGKHFKKPACVIVKHRNPCGAALAGSVLAAYRKALSSDPLSAYGGVLAVNSVMDPATAREIGKRFYEIVIARDFRKDALLELKKKKNLRIIKIKNFNTFLRPGPVLSSFDDLLLVQEKDVKLFRNLKNITGYPLKPADREELKFGWVLAKVVKSNAIVLSKNLMLIGCGAGQMSRIDSTEIAVRKARKNKFKVAGSYLASDAFFPFDDNVKLAARMKIKAIIQPGGSVHDEDVIRTAKKLKMPMIFTGMRHFYH